MPTEDCPAAFAAIVGRERARGSGVEQMKRRGADGNLSVATRFSKGVELRSGLLERIPLSAHL